MKIERVEVFGVAVPLVTGMDATNVHAVLAKMEPAVKGFLECVGPLKTADDIITRRIDLSSGALALPGGPGLGVTLDDAKLEKYRMDLKAAA